MGELWGWGSLRSWNNARGRKRLRSGIPGDSGRGGFFKRPRGRKGREGREGWYFHPPPPQLPAARPPGRGAAPALPFPRTIQAGPGPARLGPRTPPLPPAPSPVPPAPAASGGEEVSGRRAHTPSTFLQVHSPASRPFDSQLPGREGPCPPRPLPPGYIRSQRSRPPARA